MFTTKYLNSYDQPVSLESLGYLYEHTFDYIWAWIYSPDISENAKFELNNLLFKLEKSGNDYCYNHLNIDLYASELESIASSYNRLMKILKIQSTYIGIDLLLND